MEGKKTTLKKSIIICITFLAIITYLLISLNGYSNYRYSEEEKSKILISEEKIAINRKIKGIEKYIYIVDSRIQEIEKYNESYPIFLLQIQKLIKDILILNTEHGISLNVLNLEKKQVITSSETIPKDYFFKEFFKNDFKDLSSDKITFIVNNSEVALIKSLDKSKKYKIILRMSRNLFFETNKENHSFFMKYDGNWIGLENQNINKQDNLFILKYPELNNSEFTIAFKKNTPKDILNIFIWFFLPILPLSIIYFFIYHLIMKVFYNPLKKIAEISYKKDLGNINLIDYLESTYLQIEKRNNFLSEQLKKNEISLKEAVIRKFILGLGNFKDLIIYFPNENENLKFGILKVFCDENNIEDFLYTLSTIALFLKNNLNIEVIPVNNGELFLIGKDNFFKEELEHILFEIQKNYKNINLFCFISSKSYKIIELSNKYKHFSKNLNYKEKFISKIVIDENDFKILNNKYFYYYPVDVEQKTFLKINNLNTQGVLNLFEELFYENYFKRNLEGESLARFKKAIVNSLDRIIMQFDLSNFIETDFKSFFEKRDSLNNIEFKIQTFQILEKIIQEIKNIKGTNEESPQIKMKKFIENNFNREISLNEFSEYLGFTPQYASNLFKKINGENFNVYVNKYRIEKSIELFNNRKGTQLKIKQLAELVGYSSSITYINNFKKIHHISPGKYFGISDI